MSRLPLTTAQRNKALKAAGLPKDYDGGGVLPLTAAERKKALAVANGKPKAKPAKATKAKPPKNENEQAENAEDLDVLIYCKTDLPPLPEKGWDFYGDGSFANFARYMSGALPNPTTLDDLVTYAKHNLRLAQALAKQYGKDAYVSPRLKKLTSDKYPERGKREVFYMGPMPSE